MTVDERVFGGWFRQDGKYFEFDNGPTVPNGVLELIRALDVRGIQFQRGNGDAMRAFRDDAEKPEYLPGERELIVQWKMHILAVIEYGKVVEEPAPEPPKKERLRKSKAEKETLQGSPAQ